MACDPSARGLEDQVRLRYENLFLLYLPRICNHCLNPSCVASCPSGALYKREQDGIVLVDQNACRGWRHCVAGCPYKKVYFNRMTGKSEKCILCYAGVTEDGRPTVCSQTCVGRIRYLGVVLYDLDAVTAAAETPAQADLVEAQRDLLLDPRDPAVGRQPRRPASHIPGLRPPCVRPSTPLPRSFASPCRCIPRRVPCPWSGTCRRSPRSSTRCARSATGPMIRPRSSAALADLRIPLAYVANILAGGEVRHVEAALRRLAAMRTHMRRLELGETTTSPSVEVGLSAAQLERLYRLLAIAAYEERYVVPTAHREADAALQGHLDERPSRGGRR